mmetsp:Transcript_18188/g.58119  ORF Transcript_18188/g.58119 Transcript_18188/m.58119 type:complete len:302 (-) Transcript_18188:184-1089(-)
MAKLWCWPSHPIRERNCSPRTSSSSPALAGPAAIRSSSRFSAASSATILAGRRSMDLRCSAARSRRAASVALGLAKPSSVARMCTSLKKVWSLDHHCNMFFGSFSIETISCFIRSTHASHTTAAPGLERSSSMPVLSSCASPHEARSFSAASEVTSVETTMSANEMRAEVATCPVTHGRGSLSQSTSRSAQRMSKPARRKARKKRTLRMPIVMKARGSIRKYFHRVVTTPGPALASSPLPPRKMAAGMPCLPASVKRLSSMQVTMYGSASFCTCSAQLRSMSLTDAPPKTSSSGWPGGMPS